VALHPCRGSSQRPLPARRALHVPPHTDARHCACPHVVVL
jgi:hypothetical protein